MIMASIPILILRLEGVLQSWGEHSKWDYRDSASMPTKSGIIGLLGCALGLERNDMQLQSMAQKLKLAVRADRQGIEMSDFHTVRSRQLLNAAGKHRGKVGEYSTLVTNRIYLQDACFTIAIAGNRDMLERIADALQRPKWPIYLGRKCCVPSRPVFDGITEAYPNLETAICAIDEPTDGGILIETENESEDGVRVERQDMNAGSRRFHSRIVSRKIIGREAAVNVSE